MKGCLFCQIVAGELEVQIVFEDDRMLAFLDHRPLFPGHSLLIPKVHYEVFGDLPRELVGPFFQNGQLLSGAIEKAMEAEGTFVAMNNRVSQSVPHVHLHIVPRRKKDGLKGFFWPRHKYESEQAMSAVTEAIRKQVKKEANDRLT
jgi:histidine triad (HIT) family protein